MTFEEYLAALPLNQAKMVIRQHIRAEEVCYNITPVPTPVFEIVPKWQGKGQ